MGAGELPARLHPGEERLRLRFRFARVQRDEAELRVHVGVGDLVAEVLAEIAVQERLVARKERLRPQPVLLSSLAA